MRMARIPEPLDEYQAVVDFMRVGPVELDPTDNLPGGLKPLLDALTAKRVVYMGKKPLRKDGYPERLWGLWADDKKRFLKSTVDQLTTKDEAHHGSFIKIRWEKL